LSAVLPYSLSFPNRNLSSSSTPFFEAPPPVTSKNSPFFVDAVIGRRNNDVGVKIQEHVQRAGVDVDFSMLGRCRRACREIEFGRWCTRRDFAKGKSESLKGTIYSDSCFESASPFIHLEFKQNESMVTRHKNRRRKEIWRT